MHFTSSRCQNVSLHCENDALYVCTEIFLIKALMYQHELVKVSLLAEAMFSVDTGRQSVTSRSVVNFIFFLTSSANNDVLITSLIWHC